MEVNYYSGILVVKALFCIDAKHLSTSLLINVLRWS